MKRMTIRYFRLPNPIPTGLCTQLFADKTCDLLSSDRMPSTMKKNWYPTQNLNSVNGSTTRLHYCLLFCRTKTFSKLFDASVAWLLDCTVEVGPSLIRPGLVLIWNAITLVNRMVSHTHSHRPILVSLLFDSESFTRVLVVPIIIFYLHSYLSKTSIMISLIRVCTMRSLSASEVHCTASHLAETF